MARRRERGLTLIELLVVTFVLAVGLTGVGSLFVVGIVSSRQAQRLSAATDEAQHQMERIRSAGFSGCIVDPEIFPSTLGYTIVQQNYDQTGTVGFTVPGLPQGAGTIAISFYNSGTGIQPNLKDVTVTITWTGGDPTGGQTALHTLLANTA